MLAIVVNEGRHRGNEIVRKHLRNTYTLYGNTYKLNVTEECLGTQTCHVFADIHSGHAPFSTLSHLHFIQLISQVHSPSCTSYHFSKSRPCIYSSLPLLRCLVSSLHGQSYCPRQPAFTTSSVLRIPLPGRQVKCSLCPLDSNLARSLSPGFLSSEFRALNPRAFSDFLVRHCAVLFSSAPLCFSLCEQWLIVFSPALFRFTCFRLCC